MSGSITPSLHQNFVITQHTMDFTGSGSEDDPIQLPEPKRIKLTIDDSEVTIDDSEVTIDDSEPTIDDTETIEYRTLPIYDYGDIPTGADQEPDVSMSFRVSSMLRRTSPRLRRHTSP